MRQEIRSKGKIKLKRRGFSEKGKKIYVVLLLLLGLVLFDTQESEGSEFNFSATPLPSAYQLDKENSYFDLLLSQNQTAEVQVKLKNDTDKEVNVAISVNSAKTNANGVVEYGTTKIKKDESLVYDLKDYVDYPEVVSLKPKSEQIVPFKVKMPNESFDGILAGGILFKEEKEKPTSIESKQGLSIENDYSYVVGLLMRQNQTAVAPNLILREVKPGQVNARNAILANLQNDQRTYINQVSISAKITRKNSKEVLYQEEREQLQIAPNSNFSFPISLDKQVLKPGEYQLSLSVFGNKSVDGSFVKDKNQKAKFNDHWRFKKNFRVEADVANDLNQKDVTLKQNNHWLYFLIGLLLLIVIGWVIRTRWSKRK